MLRSIYFDIFKILYRIQFFSVRNIIYLLDKSNLIDTDVDFVVTLTCGQGGTYADGPYQRDWINSWQIERAASLSGFLLYRYKGGHLFRDPSLS